MEFKNIHYKSGITLVVSLLFFCKVNFAQQSDLRAGMWRGVLQLNDTTELPFNFQIEGTKFEIINGDERIAVDEITFASNDSVSIRMPFFDSEFRIKMTGDSLMKGNWINHAKKNKNIIPFSATHNESRRFLFTDAKQPETNERYKVTFEPGTKDQYFSVGTFNSKGGKTNGTFTTETGDYRYLEGYSSNSKLMLSCFDGSHAFLFTAIKRNDSLVNGQFYSGISGHENWLAVKDEKFELRNPDSLTFLKPGYSKIAFSFKNLEGKMVSLSDAEYKNQVVIIQLMGTWCPNCVDETKFLSGFQARYSDKGLKAIALAFERTEDFNKAVELVSRLKKRFAAGYDFLITGKTGAAQASEALPMLNAVMAFPTTIYIDKKGIVRKIYTGFYGPATGEAYTKYVEETTLFIEKLLAE
jgi:thiol-disulfide isomerase/thioredoxin